MRLRIKRNAIDELIVRVTEDEMFERGVWFMGLTKETMIRKMKDNHIGNGMTMQILAMKEWHEFTSGHKSFMLHFECEYPTLSDYISIDRTIRSFGSAYNKKKDVFIQRR